MQGLEASGEGLLLLEDADQLTDFEGVIIGISNNPLIHEGDALVHIARYDRAEDVAEEVEAIHQDLLDGAAEPLI